MDMSAAKRESVGSSTAAESDSPSASESGRAGAFEAERPYLRGLAYRMLGSVADAEDVLQEAFLRWQRADLEAVRDARRFLATTVARLALDALDAARRRREVYVGPWIPEPLAGPAAATEPADAQSISLALLSVLESLSPLERAAFLLHDVFDYRYDEVAQVLRRDAAAVRQLVHRGRAHVQAKKPRFAPDGEAHRRVLTAFLAAATSGDVVALERLLVSDAVALSDGGGRVRGTARRAVRGANAVARFLVGVTRKMAAAVVNLEETLANGEPSLVVRFEDGSVTFIALETDGERVYAVRIVRNPDKLRAWASPATADAGPKAQGVQRVLGVLGVKERPDDSGDEPGTQS
jgi:RNA polymerase sigma-70 factor, ECF subfamily